jgi:hypothetical protein
MCAQTRGRSPATGPPSHHQRPPIHPHSHTHRTLAPARTNLPTPDLAHPCTWTLPQRMVNLQSDLSHSPTEGVHCASFATHAADQNKSPTRTSAKRARASAPSPSASSSDPSSSSIHRGAARPSQSDALTADRRSSRRAGTSTCIRTVLCTRCGLRPAGSTSHKSHALCQCAAWPSLAATIACGDGHDAHTTAACSTTCHTGRLSGTSEIHSTDIFSGSPKQGASSAVSLAQRGVAGTLGSCKRDGYAQLWHDGIGRCGRHDLCGFRTIPYMRPLAPLSCARYAVVCPFGMPS